MPDSNKAKTYKDFIMQEWAEKVERNQALLCPGCVRYKPYTGHCEFNLIPVTTNGEDCPYYEKAQFPKE